VQAFSLIAIFIGCLGLYGLVTFMAAQKNKEIGVRKVLGAHLADILWLFGRELALLLVIAFVFAVPVAWWVMNKYLQEFSYRIHIGPGIFITAILCSMVIAVFTAGYRSFKAALLSPLKSLLAE
jgi:ABC-type antimicrobial peptide transport system permease subunit